MVNGERKRIVFDTVTEKKGPEISQKLNVRETNKMHFFFINLLQLNYPLRVSNKQVHHQEVISVHAAFSFSHASMSV
jgi:hypothetical protein